MFHLGYDKIVEYLLDGGANINPKNDAGSTAKDLATQQGETFDSKSVIHSENVFDLIATKIHSNSNLIDNNFSFISYFLFCSSTEGHRFT